MVTRLAARQELFAQGLFRGLSQREAYRQAGYTVNSEPAADANACALAKHRKVIVRLAEMDKARALTATVTVQTVTQMLIDTYADARRFKQIGAAATAAMGIAKLHGLLVDKTEDVTRKPTRNPDAPLEIEVEHWLTEHKFLPSPEGQGEGSGPAEPGHGNTLPEPLPQGSADAADADMFAEPQEGENPNEIKHLDG